MTTLTGTLTKITNEKKLLIKLDDKQHAFLSKRAKKIAEHFTTPKLPTWAFQNDAGETVNFITVALDKYDKCNIRKFETLLKSRVMIQGSFREWDFIPEGETEQICGVSFTLSSIRKLSQDNCPPENREAILPPSESMQARSSYHDVFTRFTDPQENRSADPQENRFTVFPHH